MSMLDYEAHIGANVLIWAYTNLWGWPTIGDGTHIGAHCDIGKGVVIGRNCHIQSYAFIPPGVTIVDDVFIGPHVCFTNDKYLKRDGVWIPEPTLICAHVRIGARVTLLPVTVGEYAFIGADSLVTRDIAPYTLAYGRPARIEGRTI